MPPNAASPNATTTSITVNGKGYPLVEVRTTGDILLDVLFKNTSQPFKSIPKDSLRELRVRKVPISSPRIFYRVRLETLQKHSGYFRGLLTSQFGEAVAVAKTLAQIKESGQTPGEVEVHKLPRVEIIDEDTTTQTYGRENIFQDMLRVIHGAVSEISKLGHCQH